jgi:hypothetical protein
VRRTDAHQVLGKQASLDRVDRHSSGQSPCCSHSWRISAARLATCSVDSFLCSSANSTAQQRASGQTLSEPPGVGILEGERREPPTTALPHRSIISDGRLSHRAAGFARSRDHAVSSGLADQPAHRCGYPTRGRKVNVRSGPAATHR